MPKMYARAFRRHGLSAVGDGSQKTPGSCQGEYLASPEFSACGLGGFCFHFYPRGRSHVMPQVANLHINPSRR